MKEASDRGDDEASERPVPLPPHVIQSLLIGPENLSEPREAVPEPKVVRTESAEPRKPSETILGRLLGRIADEQTRIVPPMIARRGTEFSNPSETTRFPSLNKADQVVESAMVSAARAVLWKAAALTVDTIAPGMGSLVRVTKIITEFHGAVKTYEDGHGFLVNLPIIDLPGHEYSAGLRVRAFATEAPPALPVDLGLDYVSPNGQLDRLNVIEGTDASPSNEASRPSTGLDPLFRHVQQLSTAAGGRPSEFRVSYLHQPTRTGWIVVQPPGQPAHCEAWFNFKLTLSLVQRSELKTTCPACGRDSSKEHECAPADPYSSEKPPVHHNHPQL